MNFDNLLCDSLQKIKTDREKIPKIFLQNNALPFEAPGPSGDFRLDHFRLISDLGKKLELFCFHSLYTGRSYEPARYCFCSDCLSEQIVETFAISRTRFKEFASSGLEDFIERYFDENPAMALKRLEELRLHYGPPASAENWIVIPEQPDSEISKKLHKAINDSTCGVIC